MVQKSEVPTASQAASQALPWETAFFATPIEGEKKTSDAGGTKTNNNNRLGLLVALGLVFAALVASVAVIVTNEGAGGNKSDSSNGSGTNGEAATSAPTLPTFAPTSASPSLSPTTRPSTAPSTANPSVSPSTGTPTTPNPSMSPTTATPSVSPTTGTPTTATPSVSPSTGTPTTPNPSATPTTGTPSVSPTQELAECTIMWGDMQDASSPFSFVSEQAALITLMSSVYDTSFVVNSGNPTATLLVDFKDSNGDPYNIGPVSGSASVGADMSMSMEATVNNPNFYINRMGGVISGSRLQVSNVDPRQDDLTKTFQAGSGETPSTVSATDQNPVIVFDPDYLECTDAVSPSASCSGPWYSYTYVEICAKNIFATRAPSQATAPTPLATPAPTSATPLVEIVFTNPSTSSAIKSAFENARDLWNDIITNTNEPLALPSGTINAGALGCGTNTVFADGTTSISGLTIFADISSIDGQGGILGQAGPCAFSYNLGTPSAFGDVMPRIGTMKFDEADLQGMVQSGTLERVIMHEIGHILGIGTLWSRFRVGRTADFASNPRYVGVNGVEGYKQIGGKSDDIPVANTGGDGTADSHWREETFADELMSGYATGDMPVSIMTVKSLQDLGYAVDESKAEEYFVPLEKANNFEAEAHASFGNDILEFRKVMKLPGKP